MSQSAALNHLVGIVGKENAIEEPRLLESSSVDGVKPAIVLFPENIEQISEIMKAASRDCLAVIPRGSGTKSGLGNRPGRADIVVSTKRLNGVIKHESADLVVTAECGITLADFQAQLALENQFLPVDPPHARDGATIGGIIASNDSGPMRLRYGTSRELLIGMKVVRADGSVFKGGSKVVKNVAGYDMPKLFVGSLGTLGIIAEATFRLYPVPELSRTYLAGFESLDRAHNTVKSLIDSNLVITALEHLTPGLADDISGRAGVVMSKRGYTLAVRIMNVARAVEDQIKTVADIFSGNGGQGAVLEGGKEDAFWDEVREFPWRPAASPGAVLKAGVLISDVPRLFLTLEDLSRAGGVAAHASARAANGVVIISISGDKDHVVDAVKKLREFSESAGGSLAVLEASPEVKAHVDAWGSIGSSLGLMKRIKSGFDPLNILNPGRLF